MKDGFFRIRKSFKFEAAHQLDRAFSTDCVENVHGHSYLVEVFLTSKCLDGDMMVVDFGRLKEIFVGVQKTFDHSLVLSQAKAPNFHDLSRKMVVLDCSPTAEVMAYAIAKMLKDSLVSLGSLLILERVRVHETDTGWAEWEFKHENILDQ